MLNPEDLAYQPPEKKNRRLPRLSKPSKRSGIVISALFGVLVLGGAGYFGYQHFISRTPPQDTLAAIEESKPPEEVSALVKKVKGKTVNLPEQEMPSVATVTDLSKLNDQVFFEGAQVGDKVLIFTQGRQAVLYRPSTDTIIRQSSLEIEGDPYTPVKNASESAEASASAEPVLKIKL